MPWKTEINLLIRIALVIPIGSADAERGFANMNNIKTSKRSSLEHETSEALMRIKINGPDITKFNSKKYAMEWIKQGGIRSDDPRKYGKQISDNDNKKYLDNSDLF